MPTTDTTEILIADLEEARQVLAACLTYHMARDLQQAQVEFRASRPSPLTSEIERVKVRFDGYFGDFLLAQHEARLSEDDEEPAESEPEAEDASEGAAGASEEALSGAPLGKPALPRQPGRRLKADEV